MLLTAIKMCCCNDFQEESERRHEDNRGVGVQNNVRNESTRKDKESRALFIRNHVVLKVSGGHTKCMKLLLLLLQPNQVV